MSVKELKKQLQFEHSKKNTNLIVEKIQSGKFNLSDVFIIIKENEALFAQRAAWILSTLSDKKKESLAPHYNELISFIDKKYHNAVLRATYRTLSSMNIKEKDQGLVFDKSLIFLNSKHTAVAIKSWAIDVLMNIAVPYPELQNEILLSIKPQLPHTSAGLKGKIMKTIKKINDNFEQTH